MKGICEDCGKEFASVASLKRHTNGCRDIRPFICPTCGKGFRNEKNKWEHIASKHLKLEDFLCDQCPKRFPTQKHLKSHMRSQHDPRITITCEQCGKTFFNDYNLKRHIKIHNKPKVELTPKEPESHECDICKLICRSRIGLKSHKKVVHMLKFQCSICLKRFATGAEVQNHLCCGTKDLHQCDICEHSFPNKETVKKHRKLHTHRFKCYRCSSRFIDENALKTHLCRKSDKQPKKPKLSIVINRCKLCNIDFQSYQEHIEHKKQHEIYPCTYCSKSFTTKKILWSHKKYMHTGKRAKALNPEEYSEEYHTRVSSDNNAAFIPNMPQAIGHMPLSNNELTYNFPNIFTSQNFNTD